MKKLNKRILSCILLLAVSLSASFVTYSQAEPKMIFSNTPFGASSSGGKQEFKTSEFIYGRLELPTTVEEFFKMPKLSKNDYPVSFVMYKFVVYRDGEEVPYYSASWPYMRVVESDRKNKYLNFDVLPKPSEATTMTCGVSEFNTGIASSQLYYMFDRETFPENGTYNVGIQISHWAYDPYEPERLLPESDWTKCFGDFKLTFNTQDLASIQSNSKEATSLAKENSRIRAMEARGLPEQWNLKSGAIGTGHTEKQVIDMMLAKEDPTCKVLKTYFEPVNGPTWVIHKNDYDLPLYKWFKQNYAFFAENNGRCFYITGNLQQNYEGGGTYGPVYYQWETSDEINCKYIPKTAPR